MTLSGNSIASNSDCLYTANSLAVGLRLASFL